MKIVSDAGLILSFARAGQLEILRQVVGELIIPEAVVEEIAVRALVLDVREARKEAMQLGIPHFGSLQILKEAQDRGIIPEAKSVLDELIVSGTYISDALYQDFLREVGESQSPAPQQREVHVKHDPACTHVEQEKAKRGEAPKDLPKEVLEEIKRFGAIEQQQLYAPSQSGGRARRLPPIGISGF